MVVGPLFEENADISHLMFCQTTNEVFVPEYRRRLRATGFRVVVPKEEVCLTASVLVLAVGISFVASGGLLFCCGNDGVWAASSRAGAS